MYAKIFAQIFDSSIADDYMLRHVFEDLLKLADIDGVVDMTPEAIARRTHIPLNIITDCLTRLSAPDPRSRSPAQDGRRITLIDSHRDWGWRIVNYAVYRDMRDDGDRRNYMRDYMRNYRKGSGKRVNSRKLPLTSVNSGKPPLAHAEADVDAEAEADVDKERVLSAGAQHTRFQKPGIQEIKLQCAKIGLPEREAENFINYYESNGWRVGRNKMVSWPHALQNWKKNYEPSKQAPPAQLTLRQKILREHLADTDRLLERNNL